MKKTALHILAALVAVLLVQGCTSVSVTKNGLNMVVIENDGLFLFGGIPICSGDPDYPNQEVAEWFSNTVTLETNIRLLNETAAEQGGRRVTNIVSHRNDENVLWFILKRKTYNTSAVLER